MTATNATIPLDVSSVVGTVVDRLAEMGPQS